MQEKGKAVVIFLTNSGLLFVSLFPISSDMKGIKTKWQGEIGPFSYVKFATLSDVCAVFLWVIS